MANTFLVSVADAIGLDPTTGNAIFVGTANMSSAFTLSMANSDVRGSKGNALLFKYMHTRDLEISIEQATFEKDFLALNVGESILNQTVNTIKTECITLSSDDGTVSETPVGDITVFKEDGTSLTVTPTGSNFTVPSGGNAKVTVVYKYSDTVDRLPIGVTNPPNVIDLYLIADIRDNEGTLVEQLSINIPSFQISGSYTLNMGADSVSSESLTGMALSTTGNTCAEGSVYGFVDWIPASGTNTEVAYIAGTPTNFEPAVGDLPETLQLTVRAYRGGVVQPNVVTSSATYSIISGGDSDITVDSAGLITVANTAIATDTATVEIVYNDGVTDHKDYCVVTVQA